MNLAQSPLLPAPSLWFVPYPFVPPAPVFLEPTPPVRRILSDEGAAISRSGLWRHGLW